MTDPIKNQAEGKPIGNPRELREQKNAERKAKETPIVEKRHREMMRALEGEIPNAVYESKRELVELLKDIESHDKSDRRLQYDKLTKIHAGITNLYMTLGDLFVEQSNFHEQWRQVSERLENRHTRQSLMHLWTNVLQLVVNAGIFVVLVMYLMDMG